MVAALLLLGTAPAAAQETRAELLERQRADKAKNVTPYEPNKVERGLVWLERNNPLVKIAPYNGFYGEYGYTDKPVGSGVGFGGGWRHDLFERKARAVVEAGATFRGYQYLRGDFALPRLANERLELGVMGRYRREPQEDFYGIGIDSQRANRTDYSFKAPEIEGRLVFTPWRRFHAGTRAGYLDVTVKDGNDIRFPDISKRFSEPTAPGMRLQPAFSYGELFVTFDGRDNPGTARSGAFYNISWRRYNDLDLEHYSFDRLDADLHHFFSAFGGRRMIATRLRLIATTPRDGHEVPFYFMPTLGGSESMRTSYDYRYRDRAVAFGNFEYRWEAFSGLDMALFTDLGTVAPRVADLDADRLKHAYGVGFRFNALQSVWMRVDLAHGSDGFHWFWKFSGNF